MHSVTLAQKVQFPTPAASDGTRGGTMTDNMTGQSLVQVINSAHKANFPTPLQSDYKANGPNSKQQNLAATVNRQVFPTPRVSGEEGYDTVKNRKGHEAAIKHNLLAAVQFFPTPCAQDFGGSTRADFSPKLSEVVKNSFPTPAAQDGKNSTFPISQIERDSIPGELLRQGAQPGAQLNPDWVELLMMWPKGWTSLQPQNINLADWMNNYDLSAHLSAAWEQNTPRTGTNIPNRVKRIQAIGNGQVPRCMAAAYILLSTILNHK